MANQAADDNYPIDAETLLEECDTVEVSHHLSEYKQAAAARYRAARFVEELRQSVTRGNSAAILRDHVLEMLDNIATSLKMS